MAGSAKATTAATHVAELSGQPVVEAPPAPPCLPALLADAAVVGKHATELCGLGAAVPGHLADGWLSLLTDLLTRHNRIDAAWATLDAAVVRRRPTTTTRLYRACVSLRRWRRRAAASHWFTVASMTPPSERLVSQPAEHLVGLGLGPVTRLTRDEIHPRRSRAEHEAACDDRLTVRAEYGRSTVLPPEPGHDHHPF
jgi:hypothetical protein